MCGISVVLSICSIIPLYWNTTKGKDQRFKAITSRKVEEIGIIELRVIEDIGISCQTYQEQSCQRENIFVSCDLRENEKTTG